MRIECRMTKATETYSEYVKPIVLQRQPCSQEHASVLSYTYIACPILILRSTLSVKV